MTNRLLDSVKLPYQITKGSYIERQQKADRIVNKIFNDIQGKFKNNELPITKMQDCIDKNIPRHVKIIIKNNEDESYEGLSDILYSPQSGKINATTIEIPTKNNKIKIEDLPTVMHELQHIIDQLYHPKYLARNQDMRNKNLMTEKYINLYDKWIYNEEDPENKKEVKYILTVIKQKILEFLKGKSTSEKISYLQDSKYCLQMEDKAYFTQAKVAKKLNKKHRKVKQTELLKLNKIYMFKEKIKLLNEIAGSIIGKERAIHKSKLRKEEKLRNVKKDNL